MLDDADSRLIDALQDEFAIEPRPFRALAERLGGTETETIERVRALHRNGTIREMGAVFNLKRLGYVSTLCAAQVAQESVREVAAAINAFPEVTHNYLREHRLNIWFTVIARSPADIARIIERVRAERGVAEVISLPQRRMFKIRVHFATGRGRGQAGDGAPRLRRDEELPPPVLSDGEIALVRALSDPLPMIEQPFDEVARRAGVTAEVVIERIRAWLEDGTIRRFGARVAHRTVGYAANGMSVWKVAAAEEEPAGTYMASQPEVSHCYLRDTRPGWDYNLYAMIHGGTRDEVDAVAQRIADHTGLRECAILFSAEELKKTAPRYFAEGEV
ncbi:MAG TPA: AsnC family transcriptional regulator [Candidatus Hydrogenedentes bacterium]|nr:AsnC family transcriptional regulator [Candidatus Hydrogenedentota bacterium]HPG67465.1 AsnC family transcriptional regulator [Candidatus Hydrogenedentota bacterium]